MPRIVTAIRTALVGRPITPGSDPSRSGSTQALTEAEEEKAREANEPLVLNETHGVRAAAGTPPPEYPSLPTAGSQSKEFLLAGTDAEGGHHFAHIAGPPPFYYPGGVPLVRGSVRSSGSSSGSGSNGGPPPRYTPQDAMVMMINRRRAAQISSLATLLVFLTAFLVLSTGILGGIYLFRQFSRSMEVSLSCFSLFAAIK